MRAALLSGPRQIDVVELERPEPGTGEILVEIEANAICGTDLKAYQGLKVRGRYPKVLGHEFVGRVADLGAGVDPSLQGARVAVEPNLRCEKCEHCAVGLTNLCADYHVLGEGPDYQGGCAEFVAVPANLAHVLPDDISMIEGALVQPLAISYEGIVERAEVRSGEKVLVLGAGPIGLGAMLLARLRGAQVLVSDPVGYRLDTARELGADFVVQPTVDDLDAAVAEFTSGKGVDLAVEAVGGAQTTTLFDAQRSTRVRGRILVVGGFSSAETPFPVGALKNKEQALLGSQGHPQTFGPVIDLLATKQLQPAAMVSHVVSLEELPAMLQLLDDKGDGVVKVVVEPSR